MKPRALILDLDDTLYPERRHLLSGFAVAARYVEDVFGVPRAEVFRTLVAAVRTGHRSTALQAMCETFDLDPAIVPDLVELVRDHRPQLRMRRDCRRMLERARRGWRLAILTNGRPRVQARKIAALGLDLFVDHVVFACEHGDGRGKPDPAAFQAVIAKLGVPAERCVFAGNDPWCDVAGARRAGLWTIRVRRGSFAHAEVTEASEADLVVSRLSEIPDAAEALVEYAAVYVS
ncbi:MAG TPA: HAD family hydrolase [Vicinamibacterales bacterium]|nr:HAD family hydrolase [Vicinamibacterales bacterium]